MRTTTDLPDRTYAEVKSVAQMQSRSISSVIADLTALGLETALAGHPVLQTDRYGLPVVALGRTITSAEVAQFLDQEDAW